MDVHVKTQMPVQVNDQNFCDENPIGAVTRNIFVMASDWFRRWRLPARRRARVQISMTFGSSERRFFPRNSFLTKAVFKVL